MIVPNPEFVENPMIAQEEEVIEPEMAKDEEEYDDGEDVLEKDMALALGQEPKKKEEKSQQKNGNNCDDSMGND
ncbi:hypothetical protein Pcinc_032332 [Petrolisthes cinctipes]|uniref:Uncharacterized protein n=1 Tax=Petrolisthes cinctipes TaxID=88211 RepID=A0AAE1EUS5_PETCI|nr:hypothetical protein Pcinc_032332 [Petrolisthes cinctipes]